LIALAKRAAAAAPAVLHVERLSAEGRGVARAGGKVTFVDGALAGETVAVRYLRRRGRFDEAVVSEVLAAAPERVAPRCPHYGVCGGCSLQHMAPAAQLAHKQALVLEQLEHQAGTAPRTVLAPLAGPVWGYRRKARLGVKHVPRKGGVLVGFRERRAPYVTELGGCDVLHPAVGRLIPALRALIGTLSVRDRVPQLEVAVGEGDAVAIVVRHLQPLSADDEAALSAFAAAHGVDFYLQPAGAESVRALGPARELGYRLERHGLAFSFAPTDFTQVNFELNALLVDRVLEVLAPDAAERVLDLYCGLGNFTLALARRAAEVLGVEGDAALVTRARANARANGIGNARFLAADLNAGPPALDTAFERVLLDPPRSGAAALVERLPLAGVQRLVYVSCSPATLARDAAILVRRGLVLAAAGVMDMFPHTAHVESMAVFEP